MRELDETGTLSLSLALSLSLSIYIYISLSLAVSLSRSLARSIDLAMIEPKTPDAALILQEANNRHQDPHT